jgi:hypothetical protein
MMPATPLPWVFFSDCSEEEIGSFIGVNGFSADLPIKERLRRDAAYIVHACNAFPKLVAALRDAQQRFSALSGLAATYKRSSIDPNGRVLLELRELPAACANDLRALLAKLGAE